MFASADYVLRPLTGDDEVVLWEMLSSRRLFTGESAAEVLRKVVQRTARSDPTDY